MLKQAVIFAVVGTLALAPAIEGQFPGMTPSLELKPQATLTGATSVVATDAVRATQRLVTKRSGIRFRNGGRMAIPTTIASAPEGLKSISIPLPHNELPDGGIYIVRLTQDKEGLAFDSEPERSNRPGDDSIIFRPADLIANKKDVGVTEFILPRPLEPGSYAIAIANNQYAWGFEVK